MAKCIVFFDGLEVSEGDAVEAALPFSVTEVCPTQVASLLRLCRTTPFYDHGHTPTSVIVYVLGEAPGTGFLMEWDKYTQERLLLVHPSLAPDVHGVSDDPVGLRMIGEPEHWHPNSCSSPLHGFGGAFCDCGYKNDFYGRSPDEWLEPDPDFIGPIKRQIGDFGLPY